MHLQNSDEGVNPEMFEVNSIFLNTVFSQLNAYGVYLELGLVDPAFF